MVGKKYIRRVGGGFDFCPHSIISSLEIRQYFPMTHWHGGLLPLMKLDLGKGVHLLSRSQLFKRQLANSTLSIKYLGGREPLNKCLCGVALPQDPTPYPLYTIFHVKRQPFRICSLPQECYDHCIIHWVKTEAYHPEASNFPYTFETMLSIIPDQ